MAQLKTTDPSMNSISIVVQDAPQDELPNCNGTPDAPILHKFAMLVAVVAPFVGVVAAIALCWAHGWMGWLYLNMMIIGYFLTGFGVTVGYHRMLAHRSFETYRPIRWFWIVAGALAVQKSPIEWCSVHRRHHELSDREGDPHSPNLRDHGFWNAIKGFWYAHAGWLFTGYLLKTDRKRYIPDMLQDPMAMWIHRHYDTFWIPFSFALPAVIGGLATMSWQGAWLGFLWGSLVRVFVVHHVTWSINSVCHVFGNREFETFDRSRNNFICALLSGGEGWHNNHHAFPSSARQGLRWWQIDPSWLVILAMERLGLAWNVRRPSAREMENKRLTK